MKSELQNIHHKLSHTPQPPTPTTQSSVIHPPSINLKSVTRHGWSVETGWHSGGRSVESRWCEWWSKWKTFGFPIAIVVVMGIVTTSSSTSPAIIHIIWWVVDRHARCVPWSNGVIVRIEAIGWVEDGWCHVKWRSIGWRKFI